MFCIKLLYMWILESNNLVNFKDKSIGKNPKLNPDFKILPTVYLIKRLNVRLISKLNN